jgi:transcriptional regulator with XRE-family HTH domain
VTPERRKAARDYKTKREQLGTSEAVAAELGVSRITLSRRENGHQRITAEMVLALEALQARSVAKPPGAKRK